MNRTYEKINDKIKTGNVQVLTAFEAKAYIKEKGIKSFFENVDIVICSSFEMHTNALLCLSFGQTDPLIYFSCAYINNVSAYPTGPVDLVLPMITPSLDNPEYSGAHVLEELVSGKDLHFKAQGKNLEVFQNKEFETWFNLKNLNVCRLFVNQAINQNSILATNSGDKDINSNMGTLLANLENSTFNSSSYLNPLVNDPFCKTIGIGTKISVAGANGFITGFGSNHNPKQKRNEYGIPIGGGITLSCVSDVEGMNPRWVRGGYLKSFGPVLYLGIAVPIPVLNIEIAEYLSITDDKIHTTIVDYSIPRRTKPTFGQCTYSELRTSTVVINNKPTLAAPLVSMAWSIEVANALKNNILAKSFYLAEPIKSVNMDVMSKKLDPRLRELV